jgi:hypothetical protein
MSRDVEIWSVVAVEIRKTGTFQGSSVGDLNFPGSGRRWSQPLTLRGVQDSRLESRNHRPRTIDDHPATKLFLNRNQRACSRFEKLL